WEELEEREVQTGELATPGRVWKAAAGRFVTEREVHRRAGRLLRQAGDLLLFLRGVLAGREPEEAPGESPVRLARSAPVSLAGLLLWLHENGEAYRARVAS
ncbi:hypothetical protein L6232_22660, partial [Shewanella sp. C31]|nr:hypothetical protein [Shewanella electrica]